MVNGPMVDSPGLLMGPPAVFLDLMGEMNRLSFFVVSEERGRHEKSPRHSLQIALLFNMCVHSQGVLVFARRKNCPPTLDMSVC